MSTSGLAWLDHDAEARDRTKRILALFQEQGTQDQLGIGSIRDAFSDLLFPGTSTIQTRLRYFLIVPWVLRELERKKTPSNRFAQKARESEVGLIAPLTETGEHGVFGSSAGARLKRLPSEVYWGGLGEWGIRRFDGSMDRYCHAADDIYVRRRNGRGSSTEEAGRPAAPTWHPDLPEPPTAFPDQLDFDLPVEEAEFLRGRILAEHPDSLLAWLAVREDRTEVRFIWKHPLAEQFAAHNRREVDQARMFSVVMAGAPYLYNWMVSHEARRAELVEEYERRFATWADELDAAELTEWSLDDLFAKARLQQRHRITPQTERFVREWVALVRSGAAGLLHDQEARDLIRRREMLLKGGRSLFRNQRAREERYNGGLGTGRLDYRWSNVQVLLNDLYAASSSA